MTEGVVLVSGANGGIGQYVAGYLLEKGTRDIVCHYRNNKDKIVELLKKYDLDPEKHTVQANLTDEDSVTKMAVKLKENFNGANRLVNAIGSSTNAVSWKMSKNDFTKVIEDTLLSSFLVSKAFIPDMREKKFGRIINFSSIVGFSGMAGASHYSAAKAGLVGLTKSLALELANRGITVNALALGYFDTGLIDSVPLDLQTEIKKKIPTGRFGDQQDVGSLVEYVLSSQAQFLTGQVIHLNGGQY